MKVVPIDFWPLWALIEAVILPFQGNSSLHDIQQQAEHLLHGYELDDDTLQKAQLEQQKILQDFPTNPAPGTYPKVSPSLKPNDPDNDSLKTSFNIQIDNTFLNNNNLPPSQQWLSELLALKSQVSEADGFSAFLKMLKGR
ncbi:hypothetical protein Celaphus_00014377 [Cervus elaphus hippelaphus]|uniref:Uncharacterized protein n=1 Tax=Cervus elaphus hippelaphus TaxID=46360 RepID=A0A212D569_CEREH|nr:hypothetical protein Celaphus_00014377 [Cervus elaphus hippelaphus]